MSRISNLLNNYNRNCQYYKPIPIPTHTASDEDIFNRWAKESNKEFKVIDNKTDNKTENVNHPSHYQGNKFEVIDIIEDYNLGFNLGNAIKYILRAGKKDDYCQDLNKAIWYLTREVQSNTKTQEY